MINQLPVSPRTLTRGQMLVAFGAAAALVATGGCATVGPKYTPPSTAASDAWNTHLPADVTATAADPDALARWWTVLNDPTLTSLVERAVKANFDVQTAQASVREARARRGGADADRFPTLQGRGSVNTSSNSDATTTLYAAGFDASWEADLFGAKKLALQAADANLQASVETLRDTLVSLTAEVALNYVEMRTLQGRLAAADANLQLQQETCDITGWRFEAGLTTERDVQQARSNLEQTRAGIPTLRMSLEQTQNRLAVLLGRQPGSLGAELGEGAIPVAPVQVAVGVPADVLRRRPDVRRTERQLAAQTAQVGVATAAKYPTLSLVGSIGLDALSLGNLLSAAARALTAGANVGQTIFDAGRIRQNIAVQTALQEQTLIAYESAVLTALEDAEGALVAYAEEQARRLALLEAVDAARRAATLADQQYRSGLVDFQVVLETERTLLSLEDSLAVCNGTVVSDLVRIYKALGGGWSAGNAENGI